MLQLCQAIHLCIVVPETHQPMPSAHWGDPGLTSTSLCTYWRFNCHSNLTDCSRPVAVTCTKTVEISHKQCKIETFWLQNTNRKSYTLYQSAPLVDNWPMGGCSIVRRFDGPWVRVRVGTRKVKCTCIAPLMKLQLKALRYGLHRVAPANYTIPASTLRTFARWRHLNDRHLIQLATHLSTPEGWKAELA